jgi:Domain of unknown function (DUF4214)/RTX calcium-binding nonapeptide repeat (4 copies)
LGRAPDAAGYEGWVSGLDNGLGIEQVASGFIGSPEFQSTYGALDNIQFVTLLYNNVLGRAPDAGGLAGWVGQLDSGINRTSVVVGFSDSVEYINTTAAALNSYMQTVQPTWNDTLNGGAGNDVLSGGHGADRFVFDFNDKGSDQIYGFENWDSVQLNGFGYANVAAALSHLATSGIDVIFSDQGETITFHNASLSDVSSANWLLS